MGPATGLLASLSPINAPPASVSDDVLHTDSQPVAASLPDRADAPVSEVTERFLRAVIAEIPVERIEELHLFSPLRQGTLETGIAVIALRASAPVAQADGEDDVNAAPELPFADADAVEAIEDTLTEFVADDIIVVDAIVESVIDDVAGDDAADESLAGEVTVDADATGEPAVAEDVIADNLVIEEAVVEVIEEESPYADEPIVGVDPATVADDVVDDVDADVVAADASANEVHLPDATGTPEDEDGSEAEAAIVLAVEVAPRPPRHTVYTARYRYIIKGPERGKWESSVKAEADAPLITVETVVRGVQRRAGEESEIVRYSGAQIARALRITLPVA